eukprot:GFUD01138621.1.p1 GENE.GFUD01138621.1~~GFUD01138621.1.p1  ORF type:complete len:223 (-),score=72.50 GFUD01138621.1:68-736(-)
MPSRKRNPNIRFPPSHIKRMMQQDEDIGKVAQAVPAMLARALELFSSILVQQAGMVTKERNAKTMSQEHVVTAIKEDSRLDFLLHLVEGMGGERKKKKENNVKDLKLAVTVKSKREDVNCPEVKKKPLKKVSHKSVNCKPVSTTSSDLTNHEAGRDSKLKKESSKSKSGKLSSEPVTSPSLVSLAGQFSITPLALGQIKFVVSEVPSRTTLSPNVEIDEDYD